MPLKQPSGYGVIVLKTARSAAYVQARVRALQAAPPELVPEEDEHLVAFTLARSWQDARRELTQLTDTGCQEFVDFVLTTPLEGVRGSPPPWLLVELLPTGNPPELTAKMSPEVRQMWEDNRQKVFSYVSETAA